MSVHAHPRLAAILTLCAASVALAAAASPALAQAADDSTGSSCVLGPLCGLGDIGTWLQQTIQHIVSDFLSNLARDFGNAIVGFINDVNFLTRTPENLSYNQDLVKQFTTATQVLADGLLAVVVLVGGYNILLRPYLGATYAGALELVPRLVLGGILVNTAAWWCRLAIDANNAAGQQSGSLDDAIALIGPRAGISTRLGLLDARGPALAQALAARGLRQRQPRRSDGQLAPLGSIAELKAWLGQGPLLMDGARWFGEGHGFVGIGYDAGGISIRDSSGWDTRYLSWSRLYGQVGFSGWVVGVVA